MKKPTPEEREQALRVISYYYAKASELLSDDDILDTDFAEETLGSLETVKEMLFTDPEKSITDFIKEWESMR